MVVVVEASALCWGFFLCYNVSMNDNPPASTMDRYALSRGFYFFCGIIVLVLRIAFIGRRRPFMGGFLFANLCDKCYYSHRNTWRLSLKILELPRPFGRVFYFVNSIRHLIQIEVHYRCTFGRLRAECFCFFIVAW